MVGELRARQIVHLHRLFREIASECRDDGMPAGRLDDYEAVGVLPTDFKATKDDHEAALMELSDAVTEWVLEETGQVGRRSKRRIEP